MKIPESENDSKAVPQTPVKPQPDGSNFLSLYERVMERNRISSNEPQTSFSFG